MEFFGVYSLDKLEEARGEDPVVIVYLWQEERLSDMCHFAQ